MPCTDWLPFGIRADTPPVAPPDVPAPPERTPVGTPRPQPPLRRLAGWLRERAEPRPSGSA
jgi:hypothetical protein